MKIIEALKGQKKLFDKHRRNCELLKNYSSKLSCEKPLFEDDDAQRAECKKLQHANESLMRQWLWLKKCIDYTNATTQVEVLGKKWAIVDLMNLRRGGVEMMFDTYRALSDDAANRRLSALSRVSDNKNVEIERLYDEREKNDKVAEWRDLYDQIDSKLEIINATVDLVEVTPQPESEEPVKEEVVIINQGPEQV